MSIPSYTFNRFKSTTIYGNFKNSDLSGGDIANATFDRNLHVVGDLSLMGNTTKQPFQIQPRARTKQREP